MLPMSYINMQCKIVAGCFRLSGADGIDSEDFAKQMMTSDYGVMVLTDKRMVEYSCDTFMYEGVQRNLKLKHGKTYESYVLEFAGYLYKYWISTRNEKPQKIYKMAPLSLVASRIVLYTLEDVDYAIDDIIARHQIDTKEKF